MADRISLVFIKRNGDDIKPALTTLELILCQKAVGDLPDLILLGCVYRFFWQAKILALSCFNLEENQGSFLKGDDIDLSPEHAEASLDNPVFFSFQILKCNFFTRSTKAVMRFTFFQNFSL